MANDRVLELKRNFLDTGVAGLPPYSPEDESLVEEVVAFVLDEFADYHDDCNHDDCIHVDESVRREDVVRLADELDSLLSEIADKLRDL